MCGKVSLGNGNRISKRRNVCLNDNKDRSPKLCSCKFFFSVLYARHLKVVHILRFLMFFPGLCSFAFFCIEGYPNFSSADQSVANLALKHNGGPNTSYFIFFYGLMQLLYSVQF